MLLKAGAAVNVWDNKNKATPLHCASSKGQAGCLKMLLQYGADVNAGLTTRSPLHYAVQNLATECVKLLLEAGAIPHSPQVIIAEINIINILFETRKLTEGRGFSPRKLSYKAPPSSVILRVT